MSDPIPDQDRSDRPGTADNDDDARRPRPMIERIGLALIALVMAAAFGGVAVAAWVGGEVFLAVMGAIGCLMTAWVGGMTVLRG
jgi:fatty acid desaturase